MRWRGRQQSGNVEDRRGMSGGKIAIGGGAGIIILIINIFKSTVCLYVKAKRLYHRCYLLLH